MKWEKGEVKHSALTDNVLAAHVHSGTSQPSYFIFSPYFMEAGHVGASLSFPLLAR